MLADRLKIARKKAGLSLRDLAGRLDPPVSAQALSKYEAGKMMPGSSVLVGLAKALGSSVDFLLSGEVAALDGIEFRRHSASSAKDRAVVEAMVTEKLERIFAIEDVLGLSEPADAFEELEARAVTSLEEAEEQAERLREAWDLGGDPMPSVSALLEDKGIHVIEVALPERVSGMACSVKRAGREGSTAVIVVSGDINTERKRFTLAHELGHRIIRQVSDDVRLEKAIDRFAGAFLVPAAHLKAEVGSHRHGVAYQEIKRLKHAYGVSASMMLVRMRQLGILPEHVVDYAFRTYARDWRLREPDEIPSESGFAALEKPIRFERLVYRALAEKMISPIRAAELLERPLAEVEAGLRLICCCTSQKSRVVARRRNEASHHARCRICSVDDPACRRRHDPVLAAELDARNSGGAAVTDDVDPIAESIRLLCNAGWTETEAKNLLRGVRASSPDELADVLPAWVEHCVEKMSYVHAILKTVAMGVVLVQRIDGEWAMRLRTDDE